MKPGAPPSTAVAERRALISQIVSNGRLLRGMTNDWLAEGFGVSKRTIEEDLALLRDMGYVEQRKPGGAKRRGVVHG